VPEEKKMPQEPNEGMARVMSLKQGYLGECRHYSNSAMLALKVAVMTAMWT